MRADFGVFLNFLLCNGYTWELVSHNARHAQPLAAVLLYKTTFSENPGTSRYDITTPSHARLGGIAFENHSYFLQLPSTHYDKMAFQWPGAPNRDLSGSSRGKSRLMSCDFSQRAAKVMQSRVAHIGYAQYLFSVYLHRCHVLKGGLISIDHYQNQ